MYRSISLQNAHRIVKAVRHNGGIGVVMLKMPKDRNDSVKQIIEKGRIALKQLENYK